jgi:hypothetical protein
LVGSTGSTAPASLAGYLVNVIFYGHPMTSFVLETITDDDKSLIRYSPYTALIPEGNARAINSERDMFLLLLRFTRHRDETFYKYLFQYRDKQILVTCDRIAGPLKWIIWEGMSDEEIAQFESDLRTAYGVLCADKLLLEKKSLDDVGIEAWKYLNPEEKEKLAKERDDLLKRVLSLSGGANRSIISSISFKGFIRCLIFAVLVIIVSLLVIVVRDYLI